LPASWSQLPRQSRRQKTLNKKQCDKSWPASAID
jgi:hypothetical protein